MNKKEKLKSIYLSYLNKEINLIDFLHSFYPLMLQGDGLTWKEVEEVFKQVEEKEI